MTCNYITCLQTTLPNNIFHFKISRYRADLTAKDATTFAAPRVGTAELVHSDTVSTYQVSAVCSKRIAASCITTMHLFYSYEESSAGRIRPAGSTMRRPLVQSITTCLNKQNFTQTFALRSTARDKNG